MITLVIPSYNHINYVFGCIEAARGVDLPGRKILVIDDGSTDGSADAIGAFISNLSDNSVEFISKPNSGLVSSLNLGLSKADSEFIYLVASDDIPEAAGIKQCVERLLASPDAKFCIGGGYAFFDRASEKRTPVYGAAQDEFFSLSPDAMGRSMFLNYPSPLLLQSTVFRTDALLAISGWDPKLMLDDYPTFIKLFTRFPVRDVDFLYAPELSVVGYRQHESNSYRNIKRQYLMVRELIETLAPAPIQRKAIARALASYVISALKNGDIATTLSMLRASKFREIVVAVPAIIGVVGRKVVGKSN
ncbi:MULTISPECIES: glycosyltransferase family A protein [Pseudomonas]|uniref:Glycosyltransferase n=1 Tax=Pseudomonas yamanorum TaxID=515393 RepID=A0AAJ3LIQ9_9PSED|nr:MULTISPECIES: glycosyltransferase family A protein [Pseudomonas]NWD44365.1 glycosyltransferase [Pseudomonas yamanorum]